MAQVSGFRRRAQIVGAAFVLPVMAACAGIGQDDSDDTVTFRLARVAVALSVSTDESDPGRVEMDDDRGMTGGRPA
jgi:hypothetical protein